MLPASPRTTATTGDSSARCSPGWDVSPSLVRSPVDADGVGAKFGVPPPSIPDYLALVGDSASGFPGIAGWGAKSAATVLANQSAGRPSPAATATAACTRPKISVRLRETLR